MAMKQKRQTSGRLLSVLLVLCCSSQCCSAVQLCSGTITSTVNDNVQCDGNCVLDGATINGNIDCTTGTLLVKGGSIVNGGLAVSGSVTTVDLEDATVSGAVTVNSASSLTTLTVTSSATLGSVTVTDTSGDTVLAGQIDGVTLIDSGDLFINGVTSSSGGVSVTGGTGIVSVCGSTITSLMVLERSGDVVVDATLAGCAASTLSVGFTVAKGTGSVTVKGADLASSDFIVSEYDGDIILQDAQVSDILVASNTGSLTITNANADSDSSITEHDGSITLTDVTSLGDFLVNDVTGNVELKDSALGLEDAKLSLIDGTVTITNNVNLNLEVKDSGGAVSISGNTITQSNISNNMGGVSIVGNSFVSLSCSANSPAPTGSGNTADFPDGQCVSGFP